MDGEKEATQEKQDGDSGGGDGRRSVIPANESRAPFGRKQQFLFKTLWFDRLHGTERKTLIGSRLCLRMEIDSQCL